MSSLPYEAQAVLAEHICDETTPRQKLRQWRVAFYRSRKLYAVINRPFTRVEAERAALAANRQMADMIEHHILSIAREAA